MYYTKYLLVLRLLLFISIILFPFTWTLVAQEINLQGKVQDSIGQPLAFTNILAKPKAESESIAFAISDENGQYTIRLKKDAPYTIEITYLGYVKISDSIQLSENTTKNYTLVESSDVLDEVVIRTEIAVLVEDDLITYSTDKFTTGDERKLEDVLAKLPGMEVDPDGNVTVNGKRVTKLMIDGKDFFGGDTKLGVKNIPADVVDKVEAIDNYNEVSFMKGLNDSDKMVLNIKLKEGKNKFLFGENEVGAGIDKRYAIRPRLFYYSPKTTVNFLGNLNNTSEASLDHNAVRRFRGSFSDSPIQTSDIGLNKFSRNSSRNSHFQKSMFGALNFNTELSKVLELDVYSIVAHQKSESLRETSIRYLIEEDLEEFREDARNIKGLGSYNKLKLRYRPEHLTDFAYHSLFNYNSQDYHGALASEIASQVKHTNTVQSPYEMSLEQHFRYSKQSSYKHTWEVTGELVYKEEDNLTDWLFNEPVFGDFIPVVEDPESDNYNFIHDFDSKSLSGRVNAQHFWVFHPTRHLYPLAGVYFFDQTYRSNDYQRLTNGEIHSFEQAGFGNDLKMNLVDLYAGFQYKFQLNKTTFRPGLVYHHYNWKADQLGEQIANKNKGVLLPEFEGVYRISSSDNVKLEYHLKSEFVEASRFANRLRLVHFNQLFQGNENLENRLYHDIDLAYRRLRLFKGFHLNLNLNYKRFEKTISNQTHIDGIDQISSPIYSDTPENQYRFMGTIGRHFGRIGITLSGLASYMDYNRYINDAIVKYDAQLYNYTLYIENLHRKGPKLRLGIRQNFSVSNSTAFESKFMSIMPSARFSYSFLKQFTFKANYSHTFYNNQSNKQSYSYEEATASLYYKIPKSAWGIEISGENLFDNKFIHHNSFDQFISYDQRVYIQPRTVLFTISYQL